MIPTEPATPALEVGAKIMIQITSMMMITITEAQKPKTFRVATFYAQKLSGRSARNRFSRQA